jgi:hypothetical protein
LLIFAFRRFVSYPMFFVAAVYDRRRFFI